MNDSRWRIPDWRDPDDYPGEMTRDEWRWEFLRRHEPYRHDWRRYDEAGEELVVYIETDDGLVADRACIHKYGIYFLRDPNENAAPAFVDTHGRGRVVLKTDAFYENCKQHGRNELLVRFDMTSPLGPQFDAVKKQLSDLQRLYGDFKETRTHTGKWSLYLRVLDARSSGVKWIEIAGVLFPGKSFENPEARACELHRQARAEQARQVQFKQVR